MTYLIGIGNYSRGDDGIGPRLIEAICDRGLDAAFETVELAGNAVQLLTYFEPDTNRIVIVDCARMGMVPGQYRIFTPSEVQSEKAVTGLSTHDNDILGLISYGRAAGCHVPPIRIVAIEPESMQMGDGLSKPLIHTFDTYIEVLLAELDEGDAIPTVGP